MLLLPFRFAKTFSPLTQYSFNCWWEKHFHRIVCYHWYPSQSFGGPTSMKGCAHLGKYMHLNSSISLFQFDPRVPMKASHSKAMKSCNIQRGTISAAPNEFIWSIGPEFKRSILEEYTCQSWPGNVVGIFGLRDASFITSGSSVDTKIFGWRCKGFCLIQIGLIRYQLHFFIFISMPDMNAYHAMW